MRTTPKPYSITRPKPRRQETRDVYIQIEEIPPVSLSDFQKIAETISRIPYLPEPKGLVRTIGIEIKVAPSENHNHQYDIFYRTGLDLERQKLPNYRVQVTQNQLNRQFRKYRI